VGDYNSSYAFWLFDIINYGDACLAFIGDLSLMLRVINGCCWPTDPLESDNEFGPLVACIYFYCIKAASFYLLET